MAFLKEQYRQAFAFFRVELLPYFRNSTIAFFVILLVFYAAGMLYPPVMDTMISYFEGVVEQSGIVSDGGQILVLNLLANNLLASATSIVYGIIPFLFLPALSIGMNAAMLGALGAMYQKQGLSLLLYAAALVPHGIFEIPALLVAFACGLYLCRTVTRTLLGRETAMPLPQALLSLVRVYVAVIVPLLVVASVVEAYVTPWFASLFS